MKALIHRYRRSLLLAPLLVAGALRGYEKALDGRPEWSYWEQLVGSSWAEATGPDSMLFGYLPGFATLVRPLVAGAQPLGLLLFLALNVLSCVGIARLLFAARERSGRSVPQPLVLATGIAMFLALQNNQVVAPALFLACLGVRWIARGVRWGAVAVGLAILVKTLPLTLLGMLTVAGRWRAALAAGLACALLSFGLFAAHEGIDASVQAHLEFPAQVTAQSPNRVLAGEAPPPSFDVNASLASCVVRAAPTIGSGVAWAINLLTLLGTFALTVLLTRRARWSEGETPLALLALWLSWTVLASPFGRYYYLLFAAPAWCLFWPEPQPARSRLLAALPWLAAALPFAARSAEVYVPLTVASYALCVVGLRADRRERERAAAAPAAS